TMKLTIGRRIGIALSILAVALGGLTLCGWLLASSGTKGLETVYLDRVVPLRDLKVIADMYAVNIVDASHKARSGELSMQQAEAAVGEARAQIAEQWAAYTATTLVPEEARLVTAAKPLMAAADALGQRLQT